LSTLFLDRTPAIWGAAEAANLLRSPFEIVVDGKLLTWLDHTKAYVQNVTLHHTADQVRLATVIDDFSAAPADGAIDFPVIVKHKQVRVVSMLCLSPVEPFTRIFDYLTIGRNQFARVDAVAMNRGLPDRELEDCVAGIDAGSFYQSSSHTRCILASHYLSGPVEPTVPGVALASTGTSMVIAGTPGNCPIPPESELNWAST
jgi:hypothetical protein